MPTEVRGGGTAADDQTSHDYSLLCGRRGHLGQMVVLERVACSMSQKMEMQIHNTTALESDPWMDRAARCLYFEAQSKPDRWSSRLCASRFP